MITGSDNKRDVHRYIAGVLSGDIVACKTLKQACQRHLDDLDKDWEYEFNETIASNSIDFFPLLKHIDGEYAGKPFVLYPWEKFIVWVVMGWRRKSDGLRRFRDVLVQVGRGNGKTPFAAALLLMLFYCDSPRENNAKCYTTATKRDQAALSFKTARAYAEQDIFHKRLDCQKYRILAPDGGELEALSADGKTADGLQIHAVIKDELHAWREQHVEFLQKLDTAMAKRQQPLSITITTAGNEDSELWLNLDTYARAVIDPNQPMEADYLAAFIYEIDDDDDELDPDVWDKANPMLKHGIVKRRVLEDLAKKAQHDNATRSMFRRYHANKLTTSDHTVIQPSEWAACAGQLPDLTGEECFAGFDMGWTDDLTALAWVFPRTEDENQKRRYMVKVDCWVPRGGKHDLLKDPWRAWIESGQLQVTDSEATDTNAILKTIKERQEQYAVKSFAFDIANTRDVANVVLNDFGIDVYPFTQSCKKYNEPFNELLAAIAERRIMHDGGSLLSWAMCNMVLLEDAAGYRMPSKRKSKTKIDPAVAVIMAVSECLFAERKPVSMYEQPCPLTDMT